MNVIETFEIVYFATSDKFSQTASHIFIFAYLRLIEFAHFLKKPTKFRVRVRVRVRVSVTVGVRVANYKTCELYPYRLILSYNTSNDCLL